MANRERSTGPTQPHPGYREGLIAEPLRAPRERTPPPARKRSAVVPVLVGVLAVGGMTFLTWGGGSKDVPPALSPSGTPRQAAVPVPPAPERQAAVVAPAPVPPQAMPLATPPPQRSTLRVIAMSPTNRTFNYRDTPIEVTFNHPVKQETVSPAFKVSPPMPGTFSWPTPNRLVFTPQGLWDHGATYLVTLEEGVADATGLDHLERTSWEFSTVGGYFYTRDIRPLVKAHCSGCHRGGGPAARVPLDALADVLRFVQRGDAARSRFVTALTDQHHQGKLAPQALAKAYLFRDWVTVFQAMD